MYITILTFFYLQVMEEASCLQTESDQNKFFVSYSSVNNSLEEKFIKLLLLIDGQGTTPFSSARRVVDFSKVFDALSEVVVPEEGKLQLNLLVLW